VTFSYFLFETVCVVANCSDPPLIGTAWLPCSVVDFFFLLKELLVLCVWERERHVHMFGCSVVRQWAPSCVQLGLVCTIAPKLCWRPEPESHVPRASRTDMISLRAGETEVRQKKLAAKYRGHAGQTVSNSNNTQFAFCLDVIIDLKKRSYALSPK
jgi:hypothetical protein